MKLFNTVFASLLAATLTFSATLASAESMPTEAPVEGGARIEAITVEAEVVAIDHESREVSIRSPLGDIVTFTASEEAGRLNEVQVGDVIVVTYIQSLAGELRKPTEAELANPWVELDAGAIATEERAPGVIVGQAIQAVCVIEGMNRLTRTVMITDPRGKQHVIGDVDPAKMEGVTLGDTLVLTFTRALAVSLEEKPAAAE